MRVVSLGRVSSAQKIDELLELNLCLQSSSLLPRMFSMLADIKKFQPAMLAISKMVQQEIFHAIATERLGIG